MTKNDVVNNIVVGMMDRLDTEDLQFLKAILTVNLENYDLVEIKMLPSVEVHDNDFILKRFTVDMLASGNKKSSIQSYVWCVTAFLRDMNISYSQATGQMVTDYIAMKMVTKNSRGNLPKRNYISTLTRNIGRFYSWLYQKHWIDEDINRDFERVKAVRVKKERLTLFEIEQIRNNTKDLREKALLELMLSTGMRVSELQNLKVEDMDFTHQIVRIHGTKSITSDREGVLNAKCILAIQEYLKDRKTGYLFIGKTGKNPFKKLDDMTIEKIAKKMGEEAECHCNTTVHVYRKTFASETYRKSRNGKMVSILLGHASTEITEKYYLVDDIADIRNEALKAVA